MKVSVSMLAYNHEQYIAQAINSVLMQEVNFDYEIVIGEDCSTDRTKEIVIDFKKNYPDKIRLSLHKKNIGGMYNFIQTLSSCRGEYIAYLDGDDYWTAPHKLQKQVEYLDNHPECAICFHNAEEIHEDNSLRNKILAPRVKKEKYTIEDFISYNCLYIASNSVMFRRGLFGEFPQWFEDIEIGDWALHILNSQYGDFGYIDEVMGVHRIHKCGVFSMINSIHQLKSMIGEFEIINSKLNYKYDKAFKPVINLRYYVLANKYEIFKDLSNAKAILKKCYVAHNDKFNKVNMLMLTKLWIKIYFPLLTKMIRTLKKVAVPLLNHA